MSEDIIVRLLQMYQSENASGWKLAGEARDEIIALRAALATAQAERDAENAQVTRLTSELAFVRNEAAEFNTAWAFALERVESERDAALQRAERLRSDLTTGQLHAPECPYTTADEDGTTCTCPPEQLAARWKAQWVLMKQRAEQAEAALAQSQAALVPFARLCHADGIELPDLSYDPHEWREAIAHAKAATQRLQQAGE